MNSVDYAHLAVAGLMVLSLAYTPSRKTVAQKNVEGWTLDFLSLLNHFAVIPVVQGVLVYSLLGFLMPNSKGSLEIGWIAALACTMFVDYAWYWNHRAFHAQTKAWNLHAVHHAPSKLDIFASARNSLISPVFMVYLWIVPLVLYLAADPVPFLTFGGVALVINFWGHTEFNFPRDSKVRKLLSTFMIQPEDHFWHHSVENNYCNFGTVFNFWDRIHRTWHQPNTAPKTLGFDHELPLWRKVFFPW